MADLRTQSRVDFIDSAKAWAILGVALYHYMMPLNSQKWFQLAITFGGTGIHLFFFLSGYGLGLSRPLTPFLFYKRRFVRILAPYFLFVTAVFLLNLWLPIYPSQGWKHYLSHVLLYKMFFEQYMGSFGFHLWFMSTLIQLYFLFPLLRRPLSGNKGWWWVLTFVLLSVGYNLLVVRLHHASLRTWNSFFLAYLWEFALGIWMGQRRDERLFRLPAYHGLILWVSGLAGMAFLTMAFGQPGRLLNDIFAFVAISGFVAFVYDLTKKINHLHRLHLFFIKAGTYSYEFYLVHYVGFSLLRYYEKQGIVHYGWWALPLLLVFSAGLAWLLNRLIKKLGLR